MKVELSSIAEDIRQKHTEGWLGIGTLSHACTISNKSARKTGTLKGEDNYVASLLHYRWCNCRYKATELGQVCNSLLTAVPYGVDHVSNSSHYSNSVLIMEIPRNPKQKPMT